MHVLTLAAALGKWPDPHGFAALLAGALRQRGLRTLLFDLAPAVHRLSDRIARPPGARETTYLPGTGLHLYRPGDGLTVLLPGAAGSEAAAASLPQVLAAGREGEYGAVVLCCALDQGAWVRAVVAAASAVLVLVDADVKHALAVRRTLPVTAAPCHLVVSAGRQPAAGEDEEPEALAAALQMPLAAAFLPGAHPEASERAALQAVERLLRAPGAPAASPGAPAALPGGPAIRHVPVPEPALPLVQAVLALWDGQRRSEERRRRMAEVAAHLRQKAGGLEQRLLPDGTGETDDADLLRELEAALQLRGELRRLRSEEAEEAARCAEAAGALAALLEQARTAAGPAA